MVDVDFGWEPYAAAAYEGGAGLHEAATVAYAVEEVGHFHALAFEGLEFWVAHAVLCFAADAFVGDASGEGFGEVVLVYEVAVGGYLVGFEFYAVVAECGVDFCGVEAGALPSYGAMVGEPFACLGVDCAAGVVDVDAVALAEAA